jgi:ABC-type transporter Mla maintaining outer membrane lipid asymmetry ATPase subunit MlaF
MPSFDKHIEGEPALVVDGVLTRLAPRFVLGPLSFTVQMGQHLGVIGLSGSGKSTLLRSLSLFAWPNAGRIATPDRQFEFPHKGPARIESELLAHRRYMAYVGQAGGLWPHLTIEQNVGLGLHRMLRLNPREVRRRTEEVLNVLDLRHVATNRTWEISGGEARRAAVARAIVLRPRVILLDEPDTGLDPVRSQTQMEMILGVCEKEGATSIIVSHNPAVIERSVRTVLVLDAGRIVEMGRTQDVLMAPKQAPTQRLLNSIGWKWHRHRVDVIHESETRS